MMKKNTLTTLFFACYLVCLQMPVAAQISGNIPPPPTRLLGCRFLTFNTYICVNQIEATRTTDVGYDVRNENMPVYHAVTPERVVAFREAVEKGFPGARITWGISWKALFDTTQNFVKIREHVVAYHHLYGDDLTLMPHSYFANVYNSIEQINADLHDGIAKIAEMVGGGFRPKSVIAGFLASPNMEYLAQNEDIHVCQGNIWSQYSIDNQDGEGSVCYPYYPSKEHFCKPAQGREDFIDCVNLDGWTMDFLAARWEGFKNGSSRMGVGPIETLLFLGKEKGLKQMLYTTALHFDKPNFETNGFSWVTNNWEIFLPLEYDGLVEWLAEVKRRWPDTHFITQGEFGLLWREHFKENTFNYRFVEKQGSGISNSDSTKHVRWFMNKHFRMALLRDIGENMPETVIDFTRYDIKASEPKGLTRQWSLMGDINQKQTRPQDNPRPMKELSPEQLKLIHKIYPELY